MDNNEKLTTENMTEEVEEQNVATERSNHRPNLTVNDQEKGKGWIRYLITIGVVSVLAILIGWARGGFTDLQTKTLISDWCDAFAISGILTIAFGLLLFVSNGGVFDMLSYGIKTLFRLFKKDPLDRKYGGYYEYQQARRQKKRSFLYLIIVGSAFLAVGLILLVFFYKV